MAEEVTEGRAPEAGIGLRPAARLASLLERHQAGLVAAAFAVATFLVYRLLGPPTTAYNNFVRLADSLLDGRIDIANGDMLGYIEFAIRDGEYYVIPPPWPAIVVLPGVALFGLALNQTLVSTVLGAINASVVSNVVRSSTQRFSAQIWLTVLFLFGTVYWYAASNGGVWFFSHTVAVLFLFFAIYFTIVRSNPLMAGLCLGAAYWTRQPIILAFPFFLIMFSDRWLPAAEGRPLLKRIDWAPLAQLGAGLGAFVLLSFVYNYMRFGTPLDASQHHLPESVLAQPWFNHGPFDPRYVSRHVAIAFEGMPVVRSQAPYVLSNLNGMAIWVTTPAFFYALFNGVRDRRLIGLGVVLIVLATGLLVSRAVAGYWGYDWATQTFPNGINLLPFYFLIGLAIWAGRKDKLVMACWAAIIPTALMLFTFAGTGFSQFGYRFSLDFMPFLFLLTARAMGDELKWHHKSLIGLSVLVNMAGVLWTYQFERYHTFGVERWTSF